MSYEEGSKVPNVSFAKTKLASAESMDDLVDGLTELRDGFKSFVDHMHRDDWSEEDECVISFAHDLIEVAVGVKMMSSIMLTSSSDPYTVDVAIKANQLGSRIGAAIVEFAILYGRDDVELSIVESMECLVDDINGDQGSKEGMTEATVGDAWDATKLFGGDFKA